MSARLPTHLIVNALIRRVNAEGGFATVITRGEPDAGTLMIVTVDGPYESRAYERMPQADGTRRWAVSRSQTVENAQEFSEYLSRRSAQDPDLWIVELDIPNAERFILYPSD